VKSRRPRYLTIAETLRARIEQGALVAGQRLPNQRRLAREFGVTLMTLRQALEILERENLIRRQHGLGTFVAAPTLEYDILHRRGLASELGAAGEPVATRVLGVRFAAADRRVAGALALAPRARVLVLERLRLVRHRPVSLQRSYLPAALGDELVKTDLGSTPLRQALEFKLGVVLARAREAVAAVRLGRREARELGCRPGVPAFASERISYAAGGQPVVFDRVFIPGDRFRITRELHYQGAAS
jgi:GntR family transcriptional regulator